MRVLGQTDSHSLPNCDQALRKWIKCCSAQKLGALDATGLQQVYQRAQVAYDASASPISRGEREMLYALQERLFGGVESKLVTSLEHIGETLVKKPDKRKKAIGYNLPSSGAVLVKHWRGKRLEVKIMDAGFEYNNQHYKSLSRLAREIAGYAVSGPIFFGLRTAKGVVVS